MSRKSRLGSAAAIDQRTPRDRALASPPAYPLTRPTRAPKGYGKNLRQVPML